MSSSNEPALPPVLDAIMKKMPASGEKMHLLFLCILLGEVDKAENGDTLTQAVRELKNFLKYSEV